MKALKETPKTLLSFRGDDYSEPENLRGCRGIGIFSSYRRELSEIVKPPHTLRKIAAIEEELGRIGSDREDIKEIENHLHTHLSEGLVGYININPSYAEESDLREKVYKELEGSGLFYEL